MSTWILNAPKTEAEQFEKRLFKRDPFFNRQIPDLAQAFIWLLVQKFPEYVEHGLEVPKIVDKVTEEYWQDTDVYRNFARDCITIARNEEGEVDHKATLSKTEIVPRFKKWYALYYQRNTQPEPGTLTSALERSIEGREMTKDSGQA